MKKVGEKKNLTTRKDHRRRMILLMGSTCNNCGQRFDPDDLIIDHLAFDRGDKLGHNNPRRYALLNRFIKTGKLPTPDEAQLLCDSCNRKRHGYRPSREEIFGDRL